MKVGGLVHGERGARAHKGGLGAVTPVGPGAKTLVRGQGAKPPGAQEFFADETHILQ